MGGSYERDYMTTEAEKPDYFEMLKACRLDPNNHPPEPEIILSVAPEGQERARLCTTGNFSLLIGKAKARKTFLMSAIAAAALGHKASLGCIWGNLPEKRRKVILFDTEQGDWDAFNVHDRIRRMASIDTSEIFETYVLRGKKPADCLGMIRAAIWENHDASLIIIDGLRDLVNSINSEEEATAVICDIMEWTRLCKVHIMLILHQNKGDTNARGHIGTEAINKAETVISVTVPEKQKEISEVRAEYCRGVGFEPISFQIIDGMPVSLEPGDSRKTAPQAGRTSSIKQLQQSTVRQILAANPLLTPQQLHDKVMSVSGRKDRQAWDWITEAFNAEVIELNESGLYRIKREETQESDEDNTPPF